MWPSGGFLAGSVPGAEGGRRMGGCEDMQAHRGGGCGCGLGVNALP